MPVKTMAAAGKAARVFFALVLLVVAGMARAELAELAPEKWSS